MNKGVSWSRRGSWTNLDSDVGLQGDVTTALGNNGNPVAIWSPTEVLLPDGNPVSGPYEWLNAATPIYAMIITDDEAQEAAAALMLTAPRVAFAYVQAIALGYLSVRCILADKSESPTAYWEVHQAPVPYRLGSTLVGYKVLVIQPLQLPAGVQ